MLKNKRLIVCSISGICAVAVIFFVRAQYVLPIAMYHSVMPSAIKGNALIVSTKTFERQMRFLKEKNYSVISLEQAAACISQGKRLPPRAIVLTFDDGYEDNYRYAFPILKKYGLPATVFMIVNDIGKPGKLTLDQMMQMKDSGLITFGSHSLSHPFLESITHEPTLVEEIRGSRDKLEGILNVPVRAFSYPCGRMNENVRRKVIEAGYETAVTTTGEILE